jgi:hypothetical protein
MGGAEETPARRSALRNSGRAWLRHSRGKTFAFRQRPSPYTCDHAVARASAGGIERNSTPTRYRVGSPGADTRRMWRTRASTATSSPSSFKCSGCTDSGGIGTGEVINAPSRLTFTSRAGSASSSVAQRAPTTSSRTRERRSPSAITGLPRENSPSFARGGPRHRHGHPPRVNRGCHNRLQLRPCEKAPFLGKRRTAQLCAARLSGYRFPRRAAGAHCRPRSSLSLTSVTRFVGEIGLTT